MYVHFTDILWQFSTITDKAVVWLAHCGLNCLQETTGHVDIKTFEDTNRSLFSRNCLCSFIQSDPNAAYYRDIAETGLHQYSVQKSKKESLNVRDETCSYTHVTPASSPSLDSLQLQLLIHELYTDSPQTAAAIACGHFICKPSDSSSTCFMWGNNAAIWKKTEAQESLKLCFSPDTNIKMSDALCVVGSIFGEWHADDNETGFWRYCLTHCFSAFQVLLKNSQVSLRFLAPETCWIWPGVV